MALILTKDLESTLAIAYQDARRRRHAYLTLEHVLFAMTMDRTASQVLKAVGVDLGALRREIDAFFDESAEQLAGTVDIEPEQTEAFKRVLRRAAAQVQAQGRPAVGPGDLLAALFREPASNAVYLLQRQGVERVDVLNFVAHGISKADAESQPDGELAGDDEEGTGPAKDPLQAYTVN